MDGPIWDQSKATLAPSEELGVATIAKSVTMIAKTVSEIQKRLNDLEDRLNQYEASIGESNSRGVQSKTKKTEFWRAYKALVSVIRVLNRIMTPEADNAEHLENDDKRRDVFGSSNNSSRLFKSIALALSDMETVASYVTQDEMSTATTTLSKPADYICCEIDENRASSIDPNNHSTLRSLRQLLVEKDKQLQKILQETRKHSDSMQKRSRRWVQIQMFSFLLVLGGLYFWTKHEFTISMGGDALGDTMTGLSHNNIPRDDQSIKLDEIEQHMEKNVSHYPTYPETADQNVHSNITDSNNDLTNGNEHDTISFPNVKVNKDVTPNFVSTVSKNTETANDDKIPTLRHDMNGELSFVKTRSWIEQGICDELSDMMHCPEKQSSVSRARRKRLSHLDQRDMQILQKMMIRRQVFTAIGVAAAMTLPKIAPHVFKFNLAQVLSLSFWKSLMEFLTVLIQ
jgi:hypothetical protein